jgi:hypothetical protein
MHLERTAQGDWMIDPEQLSSRLAINSGQMRQKMRLGLVTSRIYKGIDEHAGTWRVTVRLTAVALLCAPASPAMAACDRTVCMAVAIEGIPSLVCGLPARRR